ncbi:Hypothetical_protein [Hexamita inflata]|uniref:Hypothetical_protein n=1 Tax=Hexamita inflata TaxID=28002 RepID=A0ABP1HWB9_9EUKA
MQILTNQTGPTMGAFLGQLQAMSKISNITISNSRIASSTRAGLISAYVVTSQITVNNVYISSSQMFSLSIVDSALSGSIFADLYGQININTCIIIDISIYSQADTSWAISGGALGDTHTSPLIMNQIIVNQSIIQAFGSQVKSVSAGGLLGYVYSASVQIRNTNVNIVDISGFSNSTLVACSGLISAISNTILSIIETKINSINILAQGTYTQTGILLSNNGASSFTVNIVSTEGINKINLIIVTNCAIVINQSQSGC